MRTIMVRDEVYEMLAMLKKDGESFSDVVLKLLRGMKGKKSVIRKYAGILEDRDVEKIAKSGLRVRRFDI